MKNIKKTVLFLIRKDKISIRRYLLVSRKLDELGICVSFLNLTSHFGIIKETIKEMKLSSFPEYKMYCYKGFDLLDWAYLLGAKVKKCLFRKSKVREFSHPFTRVFEPASSCFDGFEGLLRQLNFDADDVIRQYYESNIDWWRASVKLAENKIKKIKPDCIIYDLEMPAVIRTFLFAAEGKKIPIVSMQHGEGFAEQYSNFPRLADYYIAYSPYSFGKIKNLNVADCDIYLTGVPDTDLIYEYDPDKIRGEIQLKYGVIFNRKIIVVALMPSGNDIFDKMNTELINAVSAILGNDEKFYILIKPHNVDYVRGICFKHQKPVYENFRMINTDYPLSKLLKISRYMVTHLSSCVVDAVLMDIQTIVVKLEHGYDIIRPPWNSYKVFHEVLPSNLEQVLTEIKNDRYSFRSEEESKKKFVEQFRYRYDNKSAERITEAIGHIVHNGRDSE